MREATAITVINELTEHGAKIKAYDPKAAKEAEEIYIKGNESITYVSGKYDAINGADAMILITEWKEFRSPDFYEMKKIMKDAVIFDGRNQYDSQTLAEHEFEYYQIGVGRHI
jgi:UDPglucose 6-dehydrogenase